MSKKNRLTAARALASFWRANDRYNAAGTALAKARQAARQAARDYLAASKTRREAIDAALPLCDGMDDLDARVLRALALWHQTNDECDFQQAYAAYGPPETEE